MFSDTLTSHRYGSADSAACLRILIVDDHPAYRHGIGSLIEDDSALTVCAEAADLRQALTKMREWKPDAAVIDISLPGQNGI